MLRLGVAVLVSISRKSTTAGGCPCRRCTLIGGKVAMPAMTWV